MSVLGSLEQYIVEQLQAGYSAQQIESQLLAHGYSPDQITKSFLAITQPQGAPEHHYYLIGILVLLIIATIVAILIPLFFPTTTVLETPPPLYQETSTSITGASVAEEQRYAQAKQEGLTSSDCQAILSVLLKDLCWQELSLQQENPQYCQHLSSTQTRDDCLYTQLINGANISCQDFVHFQNVYSCEQYIRIV